MDELDMIETLKAVFGNSNVFVIDENTEFPYLKIADENDVETTSFEVDE